MSDKRRPARPRPRLPEKARGKAPRPGQFFMVAALGPGAGRLSEEEERALRPHRRHGSHGAALREAHRLARLHGRAFAVLASGTVARPPEAGGAGSGGAGEA